MHSDTGNRFPRLVKDVSAMSESLPTSLPVLDIDILKTFVAIAELGNFNTAADRVLRTPPAVSLQIKKLEDQLQTALFIRDARSVRLTRQGESLLGYARRMVQLNNDAVSSFVGPDMEGTIRLGVPDDIGELLLPGVLQFLNDSWPLLVIDVTLDQSRGLRRAMEENRLDLTLYDVTGQHPEDIDRIVWTEKLVWAGKRNGRAWQKRPLPISVWSDTCLWRRKAVEELLRAGEDFRIAYFCGQYAGQIAAIRADIAVAPLARFMLQPDMIELGPKEGFPDLGAYHIALHVREDASAPAKAVAAFVRNFVAENGVSQAAA
jgi:DNA-binding transcriptional LysR family regulator